MEFDNVCTMVQGNLRSLQKSIGVKFCDIDRDHDDEAGRIAQTLEKLVKELSLNEDNVRSVHMLLLLNSKWEHMAYFEEDEHFCHLLNCVPLMSRYLYFKLVSTLGWHAYLGEVILHFPEFLVREILVSLEADLKYIDSQCAVPFLYSLLSNLFHKIMFLQEHRKDRLTEFVKLFTAIAKFNFEEIIAEMDCSAEKKHQYWGYVYRMLLDLVRVCIERIQNWEIKEYDFYAHSCNYNYAVWPQAKAGSCRGKHCLGIVANKCLTVSENVSIHVYMSWTEVDLMDDVVEKTLQQCVRESAYKTRNAISEVPDLHNPVAGLTALEKRLTEIELKPVTEEDEIANADADTILMNLFNPKKTQAKWLRGLINRGVFESAPHMKVVSENARLIDTETMVHLLNSAVKYLSNNSIEEEEHDVIRNTLKSCLKAHSPNDQLKVLSSYTKAHCMLSPLVSPTFLERTTLLFNKLVNDDDNEEEMNLEMVWLAIENGEALLKRAFNECLSSRRKATLILRLIQFIAPAADFVLPQTNLPLTFSHILTLISTVKESSNLKLIEDLLHMIQIACEMKICSPEVLLFNHIIPQLDIAVSESKTDDISFFLDIVLVLEPLCKPVKVQYIVLLIRILNRFRPKINNFSMLLVEISTKCIELVECAMAILECTESGSDIKWLKSMAEKAPPLTTQYLGPVLNSGETPSGTDVKAVFWSSKGLGQGKQLVELKPHERTELVTSTLKILPSLTMKEWERIGGGIRADLDQTLYTFSVLVDSLLVLLQVPAVMQNLSCFGNIITNFIQYSKTNLLPKLKTKRGVKSIDSVKEKLELLSSVLPEELEEMKRSQLFHLEQLLNDVEEGKNPEEMAVNVDNS